VTGAASDIGTEQLLNAYELIGWKLIRLNCQKRATDTEWQLRTVPFDDIRDHVQRGQNVGVQLGPLSDHLAAIDNDGPYCATLAPYYLPGTLRSGKQGKPDHYFYRSAGLGYRRFHRVDGTEQIAVKASNDGKGHMAVIPPSNHLAKGPYEWIGGFDPNRIADVSSDDLIRRVTMLSASALIAEHLPPVGGRHDFAMALAGFLIRNGVAPDDTLDVCEVAWGAREASRDGLHDLRGIVADTSKKIEANEPVTGGRTLEEIVPRLARTLGRNFRMQSPSMGEGKKRGRPRKGPSDLEIFEEWHERAPHVLYSMENFYHYGDGYWHTIEEGAIRQSIWRRIKEESEDPKVTTTDRVSRMAKDELYRPGEIFDRNPNIVVVKNGVLELSGGAILREHRPEDYALYGMPVEYDPDTTAEEWHGKVLSRLSPGVRDFLQEYVGYSLTPDMSHETAVWIYGPRGGGKSTLVETITALFGDRAGTLTLSAIGERFGLSNIPGKTLLKATEQPKDFLKATDILSALISGESVEIDIKNKHRFDYASTAKILWAMTDLPTVRDANSGIFRRIKVVRWPCELDPEVRDRGLKERLVEHELPGILNWALEGLRRLRERGEFLEPEEVKAESDQFKDDSDVIGQFIAEECATGKDLQVETKVLHNRYREWAEDAGHGVMGRIPFGRAISERGYPSRVSNSVRFFHGIAVRRVDDAYPG